MEDIKKAVITCFKKFAEFGGRADRPEFWYFALAQFVVLFVLGIVSWTLQSLASLVFLIPSLAVGARRLHDIGKSGWWMLLGLIPVIGWLVLIYFAIQPGQPGANEYGQPPADVPPLPQSAPGQQ
ncbi:DUF805 domain-containing protein [Ramlibacter solisilvae]|uniref:Membrane protein n=1 Tax=Ramlibacter tataouinensis TaxID=94132 RepID=A0A127JU94_9BURK|nr:DUF805 domain-containing protein [Ramlibacter tataouinensis]AMO23453.1 membrane protein [Ramlibacter tataouinensis]